MYYFIFLHSKQTKYCFFFLILIPSSIKNSFTDILNYFSLKRKFLLNYFDVIQFVSRRCVLRKYIKYIQSNICQTYVGVRQIWMNKCFSVLSTFDPIRNSIGLLLTKTNILFYSPHWASQIYLDSFITMSTFH
jgi:hypothetical protein